MAPHHDLVRADIADAETLPGSFYSDPEVFDRLRERVFGRSWQLIGDADQVKVPGQVMPTTLLEGCLDEPILLTRDADDQVRCLWNVCTHRGMLVCEAPAVTGGLRCRYHGRRFALDGRFMSMPEFDRARNFPRPSESLPMLPLGRLGKLMFTSMAPLVAVKPTEEEAKKLMEEMQNAKPSPQDEYLRAAAAQANAEAIKAQSNAMLAAAKADESQAKTIQTLADVDNKARKSAIETAKAIGEAMNKPAQEQVTEETRTPPTVQTGE